MAEVLFFALALVSEVIGTMVGFGSSTVFLPLALFFVDFRTALILVAFLHIFGNLGRVTFFRHGISRELVIFFGVPSVIFTLLGASLVNYTPQAVLKFILGVFLLVFSAASLAKPDLRFPATKSSSVIGGGISGFLAGLIGTGGALRGAFLTAFNLEKSVYIATAAVIALAVDVTRIPVYLAGGFLDERYYWYIPLLFILALAGSYIGRSVVGKIPQKTFRTIVLLALALIGVSFVWYTIP